MAAVELKSAARMRSPIGTINQGQSISIALKLPFWFNNSLTKAAPFLVSGFAPWCARIRCESEPYCAHLSHGKTLKIQTAMEARCHRVLHQPMQHTPRMLE
jgi:hypothetical protein